MESKTQENKVRPHNDEIKTDKTLLIHHHIPLMVIANLLGGSLITVFLWGDENVEYLLVWMVTLIILNLYRWLNYHSLDTKTADAKRIKNQDKGYTLLAFLSGCIWGSTGLLFFYPDSIATFTFILIMQVGMVSGSLNSLSPRPIIYSLFAIPTMLPITIVMFLQDLSFYYGMGIATIFYLIFALAFTRKLHRSTDDALVLKYENIDLVNNLEYKTLQLQEQTESANKANADKSQFLAAASHDLRQPLHAVNLFIDSLCHKLTNKEQEHDLNRIRRGLDSLGELFNALLDISRLDSNVMPINKSDFDIDSLLKNLVDQFSLDATGKGIKLHVSSCHKIGHSDPVLFERILRNILSNAIRYTKNGNIDVSCQALSNESLEIHIRDTGIGISAENINTIFGEFVQLDNPERDRNKGLGLGLAIVSRISKLLGHTTELKSTLGEGTEFIIHIPLSNKKVLITDTLETSSPQDILQGIKVLVIDNELDILEAMKSLIESWGCEFTSAATMSDAHHLIKQENTPDFILADYRMPGDTNGCQFIQSIHEEIGFIPSLIITGDTGADVIDEIKKANLVMLNKPLKPAQLRLAMTRQLKQ